MQPRDAKLTDNDLQKRAIWGTIWASALRIGTRSGNLLQAVVLSRLLTPGDFGLFGIAMLTLTFVDAFSRAGFHEALIQRQGDIRQHLNTFWTTLTIRGLILGVLILAVARPVAIFFNEPQAAPLIASAALIPILLGLSNPAVVLFKKELNLRVEFWYRISGEVASLIVAIVTALVLKSAWALMFGAIASSLTLAITSFIVDPFRPQIELNRKRFGEMYEFGKWIMGTSMLKYLVLSLPEILIGRIAGAATLGLYQMAKRIATAFSKEIAVVVSTVLFPVFSELQSDPSRLKRAYLRSQKCISLVVFPAYALMILLAERLVETVLGTQWLPIVVPLRILSSVALLQSIGAYGELIKAAGKPGFVTTITLLRLMIMSLTLYPMIRNWGMPGAATAVLIATCATYPISMILGLKSGGTSPSEFFASVLPNLAPVVPMALSILVANRYVQDSLLGLLLLFGIGTLAYMASILLLDRHIGSPLANCIQVIRKGLSQRAI